MATDIDEIVICPACATANRVPRARLEAAPNCGRCHQPLFVAHPLPANAHSFAAHIHKGTLPVLVDFWAPWCGPCRTMAPAFEQAARELEPRFRLLKLNTEEEQALAGAHAIRSIPTLMLFAGGREVRRVSGAMDTRAIVNWARG